MNAPGAGRTEVKQEPEETKDQVTPEGLADNDDIFLVRTRARRIVSIARGANSLDFDNLSPFLDASGDELCIRQPWRVWIR
jgi:hypothetical protein